MKYHVLSYVAVVAELCRALSLPAHAARDGCKRYELDISWKTGAPDGFSRKMILVNGHSPGPEIHVSQGECVEVVVNNKMQQGTTVHFHGIEQYGTPYSDGVPGVSQKEIPPGKSFTYTWKATLYGTYWYHAHVRGQLMDGLYGPIIVDPESSSPKPFCKISNDSGILKQLEKAELKPKPVLLADWSHFTSEEIRDVAVTANIDTICMDSVLINGKGSVNCQSPEFLQSLVPPPVQAILGGVPITAKGCLPLVPALEGSGGHHLDLIPPSLFDVCTPTNGSMEVIQVNKADGWVSLNFINTASIEEYTFSIDEHPMWVYSADGRYVEPMEVDAILIPHGSRYSAFVKLDKSPGNYVIRVASSGLNQKVSGYAALSYGSGSNSEPKPSIDYAGVNTTASVRFLDDNALTPFPVDAPAATADVTFKFNLQRIDNAWTWALSDQGVPYGSPLELATPVLWNPKAIDSNLTITTKNGSWVDLILVTYPPGPSHPIHKHGNKGYIIGAGLGEFNWTDVASAMKAVPQAFNLQNPLPKDGFYTLPAVLGPTWTVVRYHVTNPGAWLLHCHINPHFTGGMAMVILDGQDVFPQLPADYAPGGKFDFSP